MGENVFTACFSPADFKKALKAIAPYMSKERTRFYLGGVYFEPESDNELRMTATDGHKLMTRVIDCSITGGKLTPFILPAYAVRHLLATLSAAGSRGMRSLQMTHKPGEKYSLDFEALVDDFGIRVKEIEATFPDWRRVTVGLIDQPGKPATAKPVMGGALGFNPGYLLKCIKSIMPKKGGAIRLSQAENNESAPILLEDMSSEGGKVKIVIMPMRV